MGDDLPARESHRPAGMAHSIQAAGAFVVLGVRVPRGFLGHCQECPGACLRCREVQLSIAACSQDSGHAASVGP